MFKKISKSRKKIIYIILLFLLFVVLIFNINKLLPLSFKSYSSAMDLAESYNKHKYCHEKCWEERYEDMKIIILAANKDKYQGLDKLMSYVAGNTMNDDFKSFIISYLLKDDYINRSYFNDYMTDNINNNNINHMLKTKIIKYAGFDEIKYSLNLETTIKDKSLSLVQRKTALRALWFSFKSEKVELFKDILKDPQIGSELKIEAIKALSNIEEKDKYFVVSDLEIYRDLLKKKDVKLEKSVLFLLHDYKKKYVLEVETIIENHSFANSNYLLANNLLNS